MVYALRHERRRIVIAGCIAQKPGQAGHTWQFLQYLLGFRRLGCDVLFLDRLAGRGRRRRPRVSLPCATSIARARPGATAGRSRSATARTPALARRRALDHVRDADLLLNVMGFCDDPELLAAARRRVFLDTDPGFGQMWRALGLADIFAGHDAHVTIGERIGAARLHDPDLRAALDHDAAAGRAGRLAGARRRRPGRCASRASRAGAAPTGRSTTSGHRYGLRVHEFRRFADLPARSPAPASSWRSTSIPTSAPTSRCCASGGWALVDPRAVAVDAVALPALHRRARAPS